MSEEARTRRLCYYASSWLDHKGKSDTDLYPLPGEMETKDHVPLDMAHEGALKLQKLLDGAKESSTS